MKIFYLKASSERMQNNEIFAKLKFILAQDNKDETLNDKLYKYQLKILFGVDGNNSFKLLFNEGTQIAKIIYKTVDILFLLLKLQKEEREKIYNSNLLDIKEKDIRKLIAELNMLQIYDLEINENLVGLFNIISDFIDKTKEKYTLAEYIDSILLSLSFNTGLDSFLKYQIYSINIRYYLDKYGISLSYKYSENEINTTESKSINLIMDLIKKDENDFATMIQSIIILNYNSLKDVINNLSVDEILIGIDDIAKRLKNIKNVGKISVCVEITAKINTGNISISLPKNTLEKNKSVNSLNKIEEGIKDKSAENALDNQKLIIENMFNNFLNKLKMGNEALKEDIEKIKNLMVNITDSNNKLKKDVEKITEEMQKKDLEIVKLNQDIENLEERVGFLEEDCEEMKDIISKIQFRDLSKNFLKCFNRYLTNEELELIKKKKHLRGDIISNRIGQLYPNADKKKMAVIQNLVKSSSDLIKEGNYLAHSITINQYDNEIEYYKKKKFRES